MALIEGVGPGTVLAVRSEGLFSEAIRFGSALIDLPTVENHIAVVDHRAADGTIWGIEGRPGGVGWCDCSKYLNAVYTISNRNQPLTPANRVSICVAMRTLLLARTPYDWEAIAEDAGQDLHLPSVQQALDELHLPDMWSIKVNGEVPCHVVCSSAAAWAYEKNGVPHPERTAVRNIQPADWAEFIIHNHYY